MSKRPKNLLACLFNTLRNQHQRMEDLEQWSVRQETKIVDHTVDVWAQMVEIIQWLDALHLSWPSATPMIQNVQKVINKGTDHSKQIDQMRAYLDAELKRLEGKMDANYAKMMKEMANSSFLDDLLKELERWLAESNSSMAMSNKSLSQRLMKLEKLYEKHT